MSKIKLPAKIATQPDPKFDQELECVINRHCHFCIAVYDTQSLRLFYQRVRRCEAQKLEKKGLIFWSVRSCCCNLLCDTELLISGIA